VGEKLAAAALNSRVSRSQAARRLGYFRSDEKRDLCQIESRTSRLLSRRNLWGS